MRIDVTSADGTPCPGPEPRDRRKRNRRNKKEGENGDEAGGDTGGDNAEEGGDDKENKGKGRRRKKNDKKGGEPRETPWFAEFEESVSESMKSRDIKIESGRAYVSIGGARIKLGTGGYASLAHSSGVLAEGTFTSNKEGMVVPTWNHVLKHDGNEWTASTVEAEASALVSEINLVDGESSNDNFLSRHE